MNVTVRCALALAASLCMLPIPLAATARDRVTVGKMSFELPPGWTMQNYAVGADLDPSGPKDPKTIYRITVRPDQGAVQGSLADSFRRKWDDSRRAQTVLEATPPAEFSAPGCSEALVATAVVQLGRKAISCIVEAKYNVAGRLWEITYRGNNRELFATHRPQFVAMCRSVQVAGAAAQPGTGAAQESAKPVSTPSQTTPAASPDRTQPGAVAQPDEAPIPASLPTPLAMPAGSPDDAARDLAKTTLANRKESFAAMVTAAQAAGFTIRDSRGVTWYRPLSGKGIGLWMYDWELEAFYAMLARKQSLPFSGFCAVYDDLANAVGLKEPLEPMLIAGLKAASESTDPSLRFFARYVIELGRQARPAQDLLAGRQGVGATLNPVQFLFLWRSLTEGVSSCLERGTKAGLRPGMPRGAVMLASLGPPPAPAAGYGQHRRGAISQTVDVGVAAGKWVAQKYMADYAAYAQGSTLGAAPATLELVKAYGELLSLCQSIEADFQMEGMPPLVRARGTEGGESRTIAVRLQLNPAKGGRLMEKVRASREGRPWNADPAHLDPRLSGCRVQWRLPAVDSRGTRCPIRFPDSLDGPFMRTTDTDGAGKTTTVVAGAPRSKACADSAKPVLRRVPIVFSVQILSSPNIATLLLQDVLDLGNIAVGTQPAQMDALTRMLLDLHWTVPERYVLAVRDWGGSYWTGEYKVTVKGGPETVKTQGPGGGGSITWSVDRSLSRKPVELLPKEDVSNRPPGFEKAPDDEAGLFEEGAPGPPACTIRDGLTEDFLTVDCDTRAPVRAVHTYSAVGPVSLAGPGRRPAPAKLYVNDTQGTYSLSLTGFPETEVAVQETDGTKYGGRSGGKPNVSSAFKPFRFGVEGGAVAGLVLDRHATGSAAEEALDLIQGSEKLDRPFTFPSGFACKVTEEFSWRFEWVDGDETEADAEMRAKRFAAWEQQLEKQARAPAVSPPEPAVADTWSSPRFTLAAARTCMPTDPGPLGSFDIASRPRPRRQPQAPARVAARG